MVKGFGLKEDQDFISEFKDHERISDWAKQYVQCAASNSIVIGYEDKTFRPDRPITRAEVFTILCRILGYHEEHTGVSTWKY